MGDSKQWWVRTPLVSTRGWIFGVRFHSTQILGIINNNDEDKIASKYREEKKGRGLLDEWLSKPQGS